MKPHLILAVIILLCPMVMADYDYEENAQTYSTVQVDTYSFNLTMDYEIPDEALMYENQTKWFVGAGYDATNIYHNENVTINNNETYNSTHIRTRIYSQHHSDDGTNGRTRWYVHDGNDWILKKTTDAASGNGGTATSGSTSSDSYMHDGDYSTGLVQYNGGNWQICNSPDCTQPRLVAASVREEGVYWYTGTLQQVVFTVNNEFGRAVEGAQVIVTRIQDDKSIGTETTDVTGKVLYELSQGERYNITVSASGYQNMTGILTVIEQSYTLTLTVTRDVGSIYYGVFQNISFITSPSENPEAVNTNFTLNINSTNEDLEFWGVHSVFNGSLYVDNNTFSGGGEAQVTIDLTGHDNQSLLVTYFMKRENSSLYQQNHYFIIGGINGTSTSAGDLLADYDDEFNDFEKSLIATFVIVFLILLFSLAGISGDWAALIGGVPLMLVFLASSWLDVVLASISSMIIIGWIIMSNRGGGN